MALSNESYVVHTATSGDIIVPLKESVPYLNISLIGYQHFSYPSLVSQSMANMADDIKALQDGGLAAATFDLAALIAAAQAEIDTKINIFNVAIFDKIVQLTDEAVTETKASITNFQTTLDGPNGNDGLIAKVETNKTIIGDSNTGLIQQLNILTTTVGDSTSGLVQQFSGVSSLVDQTAINITQNTNDIAILDNSINHSSTGLLPRLVLAESTLGDSSSGLVQKSNLNYSTIFGDGSYVGLKALIGDHTSGMLHDIESTRSDLDANILNTSNELLTINQQLGTTLNPGLISDVSTLQTNMSNIETIVGLDNTSGLQFKITNIESFNLQNISDSIYNAGTGLVDKTSALRNDLDALVLSTTGTTTSSLNSINSLNADITTNTNAISTLTTNLDTLTTDFNNALSYDNVGTLIHFTPSVLYQMKQTSDAIVADNIATRFVTYFGDNLNALSASEIGSSAISAWIADTTSIGFTYNTESVISNYLTTNYTMADIQNNKTAIDLLNDTVVTPGSVDYKIDLAISTLDGTVSNKITILNSDDTTTGSVANSIKNAVDAYDTIITSKLSTINNDITATNSDVTNAIQTARTELTEQTNELQVEMVRYDTILPFMQKLMKRINEPGSITNTDIDNIFANVIDKVNLLSSSINNTEYSIVLDNTTNPSDPTVFVFNTNIKLDRDLKFTDFNVDGTAGYAMKIIRLSDGYFAVPDLIQGVTLDAFGNFSYDSGLYQYNIINLLYQDATETVSDTVTDLTVNGNDTIHLQFATIDIFGQHKITSIPIKG